MTNSKHFANDSPRDADAQTVHTSTASDCNKAEKHLPNALNASVQWTIPFHDLDPLEVCWHGHYVRYFELARTVLLQKIDYDVPQMRDSGYVWPVIELHVRYAQPLRYQQKIIISAALKEWENRLKIDYEIRDAESGKRLTRAHTVQVAVDARSGEMCFVSPSALQDKVLAYLSESSHFEREPGR